MQESLHLQMIGASSPGYATANFWAVRLFQALPCPRYFCVISRPPSRLARFLPGLCQPASNDHDRLIGDRGDLPKTLALRAELLGLLHLCTQAPFLFSQPAKHGAILRLIIARYEGRPAAGALQSRPAIEQILREHVGEAGQQGRSDAALFHRFIFFKIQH
jgi:hypothetical protein